MNISCRSLGNCEMSLSELQHNYNVGHECLVQSILLYFKDNKYSQSVEINKLTDLFLENRILCSLYKNEHAKFGGRRN